MRIIEAYWEKRNLDSSCHECEVEDHDTCDSIVQIMNELDSVYQVLKIPCHRTDLLFDVQSAGFDFAELINVFSHEGDLPPLTSLNERLLSATTYSIADSNDVEYICSRINQGNIFTTDRIALDPEFGPMLSGRRYANWIVDEVARGSRIYIMRCRAAAVGFFVLRHDSENVCHGLLAGVYPEFQGRGFGYMMCYLQLRETQQLGARSYRSVFSSNNVGVTRLHHDLRFTFENQHYVFVRHR